jgi:hypothetical protein
MNHISADALKNIERAAEVGFIERGSRSTGNRGLQILETAGPNIEVGCALFPFWRVSARKSGNVLHLASESRDHSTFFMLNLSTAVVTINSAVNECGDDGELIVP